MNWSDKEHAKLARAFESGGVVAVANLATELVKARGGTMTAEEIQDMRRLASHMHLKADERLIDNACDVIATQGATVATLQAEKAALTLKVNNLTEANTDLHRQIADVDRERTTLQAKVAELDRMWRAEKTTADRYEDERDALSAEVERLKADNAAMDQRWMRAVSDRDALAVRLQVAESRLAAVRDRGLDENRLSLVWHADHELSLTKRLVSLARWVLEGDAPQEGKEGSPECGAIQEREAARLVKARGEAVIEAAQPGDEQEAINYNAAYADGWNDAVAHVEEKVRNALDGANAQVLAAIKGATP